MKYYDIQTHRVKTSWNYIFTQPPTTQIEREEEGEQDRDTQINKKRKCPLDNNPEISIRQSTRPRYNLITEY